MANVNIRVDDKLKHDTEIILSELGLSMSAATYMFYKQIVRYGGIPFNLRVSPAYSSFKHIIDKLEYRLHDDILYSNYFMSASLN